MVNVVFVEKKFKKPLSEEEVILRKIPWVFHWETKKKKGFFKWTRRLRKVGMTLYANVTDFFPDEDQVLESKKMIIEEWPEYSSEFDLKFIEVELLSSFVVRVKNMNWKERSSMKSEYRSFKLIDHGQLLLK